MFERFGELAPELRQGIWKAFLEQESSHRLIMINLTSGYTIEPHKQLVSPLLSVNQESRYCALKYYTSKHDVCATPFFKDDLGDDIGIEQSIGNAIIDDRDLEYNDPIPIFTIVGSLYLNPSRDTIIMNFNGARHSGIRHNPVAVSTVTQKSCTMPQVYFAFMNITKFKNVLTNRHTAYELRLRDKTPACMCQWFQRYVWLDATGVDRYLLLWELDADRQRNFIQEIYLLDAETIWKKYKIREFAWATCETGDDETKPAFAMMVDPTEFSSSTYATVRTRFGKYVNCMVLDGEQVAEVCRAWCLSNRLHLRYLKYCDCLVDNVEDDEETDTNDEETNTDDEDADTADEDTDTDDN
ncbi:hypothetical protein PG997_014425 [Apiospora hydei]|uniref:2EXR domain-containing protein n=1 Tax=Apiospora hydei TaxID=1337664 RepID=A0ABR1UWZ4_9PEZI